MNTPAASTVPNKFTRERVTRFLLWISVIEWGVLLGAKLFDLRVLVGAWSASPPESLSLLPYGPRYPVDTGEFFIPISATLLLTSFGALISGWKTPSHFRTLLFISATIIFAILVFTVVSFWPRNAALWAIATSSPNAIKDTAAILSMVREWVAYDWLRVAFGFVGYVAAIRAISIPFPAVVDSRPVSLGMKVLYGICIGIVLLFVVYFISKV